MASVKEVRPWQNWDKGTVTLNVDAYWRNSQDEAALRQAVVADFMRHKTSGGILEVGCGSGLIYEALQAADAFKGMGSKYRGGDVTPEMITLARQRFPLAKFEVMDVLHLTMQPFNNVLCVQVLQHLPDYRPAVLELLSVTRNVLYIVTWLAADDNIALRRDDGLGEGFSFYTNTYKADKFLAFLRAQPRVKSVTDTFLSGLSHGIAVQMEAA